ncbi:hypothetical protein E3Q22_04145 [Wallemia mellicola]|uniref:Importin N-terminal domain-containing protein n=1 Tax=Wallemia mellicola TaxID=1708541 RepID=A0A4V4MF69_9BASI|nr:hypothetical protein E3Q23_03879 [Wallemia mellicola]TIB74652.1 hypothetical protein E3Q22_04145 [Wallemia mellicola]TIB86774.1 hypothetical protein E3Q19_03800 [Wallemia mellicola]TIB95097.1 hypothetical protein E3Q18_03973 [Wallemia mellicola]TIC22640.1 hypothetical protein E3Q11_04091 [Wallemia mellicola]
MSNIPLDEIISNIVQPKSNDVIRYYQNELLNIQKSAAGWQLMEELLELDDTIYKFYGALTAQIKASNDFIHLNEDDKLSFQQKILHYTNQNNQNKLLSNKLLSTLIVTLVKSSLNDLFSILSQVHLPDSFKLAVVLEDLVRLEFSKEQTQQLRQQLLSNKDYIETTILSNLEDLDATTTSIENYLKFNSSHDFLDRLLNVLLSTINTENYSKVAAIVEILITFKNYSVPVSQLLTSPLTSQVWQECVENESSDENSQAIVNLLMSFVDSYTDFIINQPTSQTTHGLLQLALSATSFPGVAGSDETISESSLDIWFQLQDTLSDDPTNIEHFKDYFTQLSYILLTKSVFPSSIAQNQLARDQFLSYRQVVGDTFIYSYYVLRNGLIEILYNTLNNVLQSSEQVESTLFAFKSIQEALPEDDSAVNRLFNPQFIDIVSSHSQRTQRTLLIVIDEYSPQISNHPSVLPPLLNFVVSKLSDIELATPAANALRSLCGDCKQHLIQEIGAFGELHTNLSTTVPVMERSKVIQAIVSIVNALPPFQAKDPLIAMVRPLIDIIFANIDIAIKAKESPQRDDVLIALDNLLAVSKGLVNYDEDVNQNAIDVVGNDEAVTQLRKQLIEIGAKIAMEGTSDSDLSTQIYGDIVKSLTISPTQPTLLTPSIEDLLNITGMALSTLIPSSIWLSLSTSLINRSKLIIDENPHTRDALVSIILQLVTIAWSGISKRLTDEFKMQDHPDLTSTFFGLLTMLTKTLPIAFLQLDGAVLEGLLTFSTVALKIPERHSLRSAADFVASVIFQTRNLPTMEQGIVDNLLKQYGAPMVRISLIGAAHNAPRSQVPILGEIVFLFVVKLSSQSERWVEAAVLEPLDVYSRASLQDKEKLAKTINANLSARTARRVKEACSEFAGICRGTQGSAFGMAVSAI